MISSLFFNTINILLLDESVKLTSIAFVSVVTFVKGKVFVSSVY